jgi:hypothetical protein
MVVQVSPPDVIADFISREIPHAQQRHQPVFVYDARIQVDGPSPLLVLGSSGLAGAAAAALPALAALQLVNIFNTTSWQTIVHDRLAPSRLQGTQKLVIPPDGRTLAGWHDVSRNFGFVTGNPDPRAPLDFTPLDLAHNDPRAATEDLDMRTGELVYHGEWTARHNLAVAQWTLISLLDGTLGTLREIPPNPESVVRQEILFHPFHQRRFLDQLFNICGGQGAKDARCFDLDAGPPIDCDAIAAACLAAAAGDPALVQGCEEDAARCRAANADANVWAARLAQAISRAGYSISAGGRNTLVATGAFTPATFQDDVVAAGSFTLLPGVHFLNRWAGPWTRIYEQLRWLEWRTLGPAEVAWSHDGRYAVLWSGPATGSAQVQLTLYDRYALGGPRGVLTRADPRCYATQETALPGPSAQDWFSLELAAPAGARGARGDRTAFCPQRHPLGEIVSSDPDAGDRFLHLSRNLLDPESLRPIVAPPGIACPDCEPRNPQLRGLAMSVGAAATLQNLDVDGDDLPNVVEAFNHYARFATTRTDLARPAAAAGPLPGTGGTAGSAPVTGDLPAEVRADFRTTAGTPLYGRAVHVTRDLDPLVRNTFADRPPRGPLGGQGEDLTVAVDCWRHLRAQDYHQSGEPHRDHLLGGNGCDDVEDGVLAAGGGYRRPQEVYPGNPDGNAPAPPRPATEDTRGAPLIADGAWLPLKGPGWVMAPSAEPYLANNFAALRMLRVLTRVAALWQQRRPFGPRIVIGDLSHPGGGQYVSLTPRRLDGGAEIFLPALHATHQTGVEASIPYLKRFVPGVTDLEAAPRADVATLDFGACDRAPHETSRCPTLEEPFLVGGSHQLEFAPDNVELIRMFLGDERVGRVDVNRGALFLAARLRGVPVPPQVPEVDPVAVFADAAVPAAVVRAKLRVHGAPAYVGAMRVVADRPDTAVVEGLAFAAGADGRLHVTGTVRWPDCDPRGGREVRVALTFSEGQDVIFDDNARPAVIEVTGTLDRRRAPSPSTSTSPPSSPRRA